MRGVISIATHLQFFEMRFTIDTTRHVQFAGSDAGSVPQYPLAVVEYHRPPVLWATASCQHSQSGEPWLQPLQDQAINETGFGQKLWKSSRQSPGRVARRTRPAEGQAPTGHLQS